MKVLHRSYNWGTIAEIYNVGMILNWNIDIDLDILYGDKSSINKYKYTKEQADQEFKENKEKWKEYDLIIVTDTPVLARSLLQADPRDRPIVVIICDGRFNYLIENDESFTDLFRNIKNLENVYLLTNNYYDLIYLKCLGIDLSFDDYDSTILPIGSITNNKIITNVRECFGYYHNNIKITTSSFGQTDVTVDLSNKKIEDISIIDVMKKSNIKYELLETYKLTPNGILPRTRLSRFKGVIYIPHKTNTTCLLENLSCGVVYIIPTIKFLSSLKNYNFFEDYPSSLEYTLENSYWYYPYFSSCFLYFDNMEELIKICKAPLSDFHEKRIHIHNFMHKHISDTTDNWKKLEKKLSNKKNYEAIS